MQGDITHPEDREGSLQIKAQSIKRSLDMEGRLQ